MKKIKHRKIIIPELLKVPLDYSLSTDGITQSLMKKFICPRKAVIGLNRWTKEESKTSFGSCLHTILENIYNSYGWNKSVPTESILKSWLKKYLVSCISENYGRKYIEQLQQDIQILNTILPLYIDHYKKDFTTKKWIELESINEINFHGFRLRCKIDGMYKTGSSSLWLMENKSKSRIQEDKLLFYLNLDFQNLFYITIMEQKLKKEISGVTYNIVRNPKSKPRKSESQRQFFNRLQNEIKKDPKHYFKRFELCYTKKEKEDFKRDLEIQLHEVDTLLASGNYFYQNRLVCESEFGCDYLEACATNSLKNYKQKKSLFEELQDD